MIYSYDLETQLLAGLIKYPERYADVASFITERDAESTLKLWHEMKIGINKQDLVDIFEPFC